MLTNLHITYVLYSHIQKKIFLINSMLNESSTCHISLNNAYL